MQHPSRTACWSAGVDGSSLFAAMLRRFASLLSAMCVLPIGCEYMYLSPRTNAWVFAHPQR